MTPPIKVLVLGVDQSIVRELDKALDSWSIESAASVEWAIDALQKGGVDVVVIGLPMDGGSVARIQGATKAPIFFADSHSGAARILAKLNSVAHPCRLRRSIREALKLGDSLLAKSP